MKQLQIALITLLAVFLLFFQTTVDIACSAENSSGTKAQKGPEKNKSFFSFFEKIFPKNSFSSKSIKIVDLDSVVDYMRSKGIKAKPLPDDNFAVPLVMQLSNTFTGYKIQNYIFMAENEEVIYGVFEFSTRIQAEASVERVKAILSLFNEDAKETDIYARNLEKFVVVTMKNKTKVVNAIKNY